MHILMVAYHSFHHKPYTIYNKREPKSVRVILTYVLCKQYVYFRLNVTSTLILLLALKFVYFANIVWTYKWLTVSMQNYLNHFNYYLFYYIEGISQWNKEMGCLSQIKLFIWKQAKQCITHFYFR